MFSLRAKSPTVKWKVVRVLGALADAILLTTTTKLYEGEKKKEVILSRLDRRPRQRVIGGP